MLTVIFRLWLVFLFLFAFNPSVMGSVSFALIDADANVILKDYGEFQEGDTIDLGQLQTSEINIAVIFDSLLDQIHSVQFGLDSIEHFLFEKFAPYCLMGDTLGDYFGWAPSLGKHKIHVTAWTLREGEREKLAETFFTFFVTRTKKKEIPPKIVKHHSGPFTINGWLKEWGRFKKKATIQFEDLALERDPAVKNRAWGKIFWREKILYFGFLISDSRLTGHTFNNQENLNKDDGIHFFFAIPLDPLKKDEFRVTRISLGINNNSAVATGLWGLESGWKKPLRREATPPPLNFYVRPNGTINNNKDLDSGYQVELGIDLEMALGRDVFGETLLVAFQIRDYDFDRGSFTFEYPKGEDILNKINQWEPLVFGQKDSRPGKAEIRMEKQRALKKRLGILISLGLLAGIFLFIKLRNRGSKFKGRGKKEALWNKMDVFINDHFKEKILLEDFCKGQGISLRLVQKWLKDQRGTTFGDLLTQRRMQEAKELLEKTEKSISEICFEVGYNNSSYFSSAFKKHFRVSPTELRNL